jgi:hypothetical protein
MGKRDEKIIAAVIDSGKLENIFNMPGLRVN